MEERKVKDYPRSRRRNSLSLMIGIALDKKNLSKHVYVFSSTTKQIVEGNLQRDLNLEKHFL